MMDNRLRIAINLALFAITLWFVVVTAQAMIPWLIETIGVTRVTIVVLLLVGLGAALGLIFLIVEGSEDQQDE